MSHGDKNDRKRKSNEGAEEDDYEAEVELAVQDAFKYVKS
ncbi:hypothetical protein Aduo_006439 [Ancylostoma duodenale]